MIRVGNLKFLTIGAEGWTTLKVWLISLGGINNYQGTGEEWRQIRLKVKEGVDAIAGEERVWSQKW